MKKGEYWKVGFTGKRVKNIETGDVILIGTPHIEGTLAFVTRVTPCSITIVWKNSLGKIKESRLGKKPYHKIKLY